MDKETLLEKRPRQKRVIVMCDEEKENPPNPMLKIRRLYDWQ